MKMLKNIAIVAFASSFMFAGIGYHMANNYTGMDDANGASVTPSYGVTYDLNGQTSVGYDSELGMMMTFAAPAGTSLRLGWVALVDGGFVWDNPGGAGTCDDGASLTEADCVAAGDAAAKTSIGLGFTWWSGGDGLNTSISTSYDMVLTNPADAAADNTNDGNLSVTVGFGF